MQVLKLLAIIGMGIATITNQAFAQDQTDGKLDKRNEELENLMKLQADLQRFSNHQADIPLDPELEQHLRSYDNPDKIEEHKEYFKPVLAELAESLELRRALQGNNTTSQPTTPRPTIAFTTTTAYEEITANIGKLTVDERAGFLYSMVGGANIVQAKLIVETLYNWFFLTQAPTMYGSTQVPTSVATNPPTFAPLNLGFTTKPTLQPTPVPTVISSSKSPTTLTPSSAPTFPISASELQSLGSTFVNNFDHNQLGEVIRFCVQGCTFPEIRNMTLEACRGLAETFDNEAVYSQLVKCQAVNEGIPVQTSSATANEKSSFVSLISLLLTAYVAVGGENYLGGDDKQKDQPKQQGANPDIKAESAQQVNPRPKTLSVGNSQS